MNKIILTGRLIKNIELKYTKNSKEYARFTLAVQREVKNQLGEYETDFINCIAYGATAKLLSEYTMKGDKIGIEGRLQVSTYEKDGNKIYSSDVVLEKLEFLQPKRTNTEKENKEIQTTVDNNKQERDLFEEFGEEIKNEDLLPF